MKWFLPLLILLGGCLLQGCPSIPGPPATTAYPSRVIMNSVDAVALIRSDRGSCAGAFLPDGRVLTAAHCLGPGLKISTMIEQGAGPMAVWLPVSCSHVNSNNDVAVLELRGNFPNQHGSLNVARFGPDWGDPVAAIGHPAGLSFSVTVGIISHPNRRFFDGQWIQADSNAWFGNSGGPLLDRFGQVVGVCSRLVDVPHLALFTHTDVINAAMEAPMSCDL